MLAIAALATSARADDFALKAKDRVVFFGDSITEQRMYTRYVQQYCYVRYPDRDIRFFNAGWSGDTARKAGERLERDVLALSPTVVTLFFGMNDGRYQALDQTIVDDYAVELRDIVERLQERKVRVIVFSPGCVDPDRNQHHKKVNYNIALGALARASKAVADEAGCLHVDLWRPMLALQNSEKETNKHFTIIPDAVHPSAAGHLHMAKIMLAGLGAEPLADLGFVDVRTGEADGLRVEDGSEPHDVTIVTTKPVPPAYWIETGSLYVARQGGFLDELAGQRLVVRELVKGAYDVAVGDGYLGTFSAEDLSAGVALAGSWSHEARDVHDLVRTKESQYYRAWREFRLPFEGKPGLDAVLKSMLGANEALHEMVRAQCKAVEGVRIRLNAVPTGENLARGRKFESSDPNKWWNGLTDGSWGETYRDTYATGDSDVFPKWVTIELAGNKKVGAVRLGVPAFGSTHTVEIGLSRSGKKFTDVGTVTFAQGIANRRTVRFDPKFAKYVRLVFRGRHPKRVVHDPNHIFLTEVEVYGK